MLPVADAMPVPPTTPSGLRDREDAADPAAPADRHLVGHGRGDRGEHRVQGRLHPAPAERHHDRAVGDATAPPATAHRRARRPTTHGSRRPIRSVVRSENAPNSGLQITDVERAQPEDEGEDLLLVDRVDRLGLLREQHLDRPEEPGPQPDAGQGQERHPARRRVERRLGAARRVRRPAPAAACSRRALWRGRSARRAGFETVAAQPPQPARVRWLRKARSACLETTARAQQPTPVTSPFAYAVRGRDAVRRAVVEAQQRVAAQGDRRPASPSPAGSR